MEFAALIPMFSTLIERLFPDPKAQADAKLALQQAALSAQQEADKAEAAEMESKSKVITAEAGSTYWLTATWRPCLMWLFIMLIANQYFLVPMLIALGMHIALPDLPPQAWTMLTVGMGGYIVGRSGEKMLDTHTQGKVAVAQSAATVAVATKGSKPTSFASDAKKAIDETINKLGL